MIGIEGRGEDGREGGKEGGREEGRTDLQAGISAHLFQCLDPIFHEVQL